MIYSGASYILGIYTLLASPGCLSPMNEASECLILRPKKLSALGLLIVCSLFVAAGVWMGSEGKWIGYLCAAFFGLGIPVSLVQMLPGSAQLQISRDGLSIVHMFRATVIPWSVIDRFFVVSLQQNGLTVNKMVGFNYVPSYDRSRRARRFSAAIAGCEGALPDTYGMRAEELAEKLNRSLDSFASGNAAEPSAAEH